MRKRIQTVLALWVGCSLLGGCTNIEIIPPGEDMQAEDSRPGGADVIDPPWPDLTDLQPDLTDAKSDMTQPPTDAGGDGVWTLQGSFVGGAVTGGQGGYQLRGQFLWHGAISGTGGGYTLSAWLL